MFTVDPTKNCKFIRSAFSTLRPRKHNLHGLGMLSFGKDTSERVKLSDSDPVHREDNPAGQGFLVSRSDLQYVAKPSVNYNRP